ncbi:MAG: DUF1343 domain-containing protein [Defluviitaleaceae bacterium]|nr:DUF1343 domain-containing protein [Defluviitaleaceae bacterium]
MRNGIDSISEVKSLLKGLRGGLITNQTGVNKRLAASGDLLAEHLACFFGPEHGIRGVVQDELHVGHSVDPVTGLPEFSLFGDTLAPTDEMLELADCLIFDIQDVGVRFYTYAATMALCMEAARNHGKRFIVLDRYNPIGRAVQGVLPGDGFRSFLSFLPVTTRHGMTMGELAVMFQKQNCPELDLHVVKIRDWAPTEMPCDGDTGILWVPPSPNIPTRQCTWTYPGTCLIEGTSVSEGRGTTKPFEQIGAPWLNAQELAAEMNKKSLPGFLFRPTYFTPVEFKHKDIPCQGVHVHVTDPRIINPVRMGVHLIHTLRRLSGENLTWRFLPEYDNYMIDLLHGNDRLRLGAPTDEIFGQMEADEAMFREASREFHLY